MTHNFAGDAAWRQWRRENVHARPVPGRHVSGGKLHLHRRDRLPGTLRYQHENTNHLRFSFLYQYSVQFYCLCLCVLCLNFLWNKRRARAHNIFFGRAQIRPDEALGHNLIYWSCFAD